MKNQTLHDLFLTKLHVLLDVEEEIIKALPKMAKQATTKELTDGFEEHLNETKTHAERLKQALEILGEKPKKVKSEAIRGLVKDAEWIMKNVERGDALDANLIAGAQYVEHYEMAGYGTAVAWAKTMGHNEVMELLKETLEEEKSMDKKLTELATSTINDNANEAGIA